MSDDLVADLDRVIDGYDLNAWRGPLNVYDEVMALLRRCRGQIAQLQEEHRQLRRQLDRALTREALGPHGHD